MPPQIITALLRQLIHHDTELPHNVLFVRLYKIRNQDIYLENIRNTCAEYMCKNLHKPTRCNRNLADISFVILRYLISGTNFHLL